MLEITATKHSIGYVSRRKELIPKRILFLLCSVFAISALLILTSGLIFDTLGLVFSFLSPVYKPSSVSISSSFFEYLRFGVLFVLLLPICL